MSDDDRIRERIVRAYCAVSPGGRPPPVNGEGELDSLSFLEFISLLEQEFDIVVELADLNDTNFKTTDATIDFVRSRSQPARHAG